MKKVSALILLLSTATLTVSAQKKLYLSQNPRWEEWADSPRVHAVPPEYASQPAIILMDDNTLDYRLEGGQVVKHTTRHRLIKVLDERGVEEFDQVLIPLEHGTRVPVIKARVISPQGKIKYYNFERAFYYTDAEGRYTFLWPLDGVEKGSEVEYLVKEISKNDNFGRVTVQSTLPVATSRFRLSYPKNMELETRSFNGFPTVKPQLQDNRMKYRVELSNIPALMPEKESFYNLRTMAMEYRISYFLNENGEKIKRNSFDSLAHKIHYQNYNFTTGDLAAVNEFLRDLDVRPFGNEEENIRKIENGIKGKITLYPYVDFEERKEVLATDHIRSMSVYSAGYDDEKSTLDTVISKSAGSYKSYIKLFAACLTQAGIRHEIGWGWDRTHYRRDLNFESWMGLTKTLIYFPDLKKYLAPTEIYLRYPVIPSEVAGSKGVFDAIPPRGKVTGRLYHIHNINPLTAKDNRHDITASVSFNKAMDAKVDLAHEWTGYASAGIREELPFVRKENMKKYAADLLEVTDNPEDITSYSFTNDDPATAAGKPLTLYASVNSTTLVNKASSKYLINVGKLIGAQQTLFDEKQRTLPVDIDYPNAARHTITINIPRGYKIANPEVLRMSADYLNGELEKVINFSSDYKLIRDAKNGDRLVITVRESYSQLHFPLIEYQRYRKVFDAAADFNNLALVMVRK
ncbi:MAG: DUF3857 domain-containing protein [Taibaiella sp.]|nr:DUF3857 domain-containing protein [Taibaiella sp.]